MEIDTKAVKERYSETESDLLQNHQSRLEGDHENVEDVDKKTLEMGNIRSILRHPKKQKAKHMESEHLKMYPISEKEIR